MKLKMQWNLPNILTLMRMLMVGVFMYLFLGAKSYWWALAVYARAAFTDILDGYIARKYDLITDFGKLMDPLADKLMLFAAMFCLTYAGMIHWIFIVVIAVRDLCLIIGSALLLKHNLVVYARIWGKLSTLFFNAGVVLSIISNYVEWISPWHMAVLGIAIVFAFIAFCQYAASFFKSKNSFGKGGDAEDTEGVDTKKD